MPTDRWPSRPSVRRIDQVGDTLSTEFTFLYKTKLASQMPLHDIPAGKICSRTRTFSGRARFHLGPTSRFACMSSCDVALAQSTRQKLATGFGALVP
jgi:hypothetical protein